MKTPTMTTYEQRAKVIRMITRYQATIIDSLDTALAPFDVSAAQYIILSTLWFKRADTAAQICKDISYTPGAMTRMLDRLENKQLLMREPDPQSRRSIRLKLTEQGQEKFPILLAETSKVVDKFIGKLSAEELQQLETLIAKILT